MKLPSALVFTFVGFFTWQLSAASQPLEQVVPGGEDGAGSGAVWLTPESSRYVRETAVPDVSRRGDWARGFPPSGGDCDGDAGGVVPDLGAKRAATPVEEVYDRVLRMRAESSAGDQTVPTWPIKRRKLNKSGKSQIAGAHVDKAQQIEARMRLYPDGRRLEVRNGMGLLKSSFRISAEELGKGSVGTVFHSVTDHYPDHGEIAIKCAKLAHRRLLQHEAKLMKRIGGKRHILGCLDHFPAARTEEQTDDKLDFSYFLVMPYAGRSLDDVYRVDKVQFTTNDLTRIGWQASNGLAYLHVDCGIVHGDIKPENMLFQKLGETFKVTLADLGIARKSEKWHGLRTMASRYYRPPEILLGWLQVPEAGVIPEKVDTYGLGASLAEVAAGATLFMGTGEENQLSLIFEITGAPKTTFGNVHGDCEVEFEEYPDDPAEKERRTFKRKLEDLPKPISEEEIARRLLVFIEYNSGLKRRTEPFVKLMRVVARMIYSEAAERPTAAEVLAAISRSS